MRLLRHSNETRRHRQRSAALLAILCLTLAACGGGDGGGGGESAGGSDSPATQPPSTSSSINGITVSDITGDNATGSAICPAGGKQVNGGSLVQYACNGSGGGGVALVVQTTLSAGSVECPLGGAQITIGVDGDGNNSLTGSEITQVRNVCDGEPVVPLQNLVAITAEPAGANCPNGGDRLSSGMDLDRNWQLQASEVTNVSYNCRRSAGSTTAMTSKTLGTTVSDPCGVRGGTQVTSSVDGSVTQVSYLCSAPTSGFNFGAALLSASGPIAPGDANCPAGGTRVITGRSSNRSIGLAGDNVLDITSVCAGNGHRPVIVVRDDKHQLASNVDYVAAFGQAPGPVRATLGLPAAPSTGDVVHVEGAAGTAGWTIVPIEGQGIVCPAGSPNLLKSLTGAADKSATLTYRADGKWECAFYSGVIGDNPRAVIPSPGGSYGGPGHQVVQLTSFFDAIEKTWGDAPFNLPRVDDDTGQYTYVVEDPTVAGISVDASNKLLVTLKKAGSTVIHARFGPDPTQWPGTSLTVQKATPVLSMSVPLDMKTQLFAWGQAGSTYSPDPSYLPPGAKWNRPIVTSTNVDADAPPITFSFRDMRATPGYSNNSIAVGDGYGELLTQFPGKVTSFSIKQAQSQNYNAAQLDFNGTYDRPALIVSPLSGDISINNYSAGALPGVDWLQFGHIFVSDPRLVATRDATVSFSKPDQGPDGRNKAPWNTDELNSTTWLDQRFSAVFDKPTRTLKVTYDYPQDTSVDSISALMTVSMPQTDILAGGSKTVALTIKKWTWPKPQQSRQLSPLPLGVRGNGTSFPTTLVAGPYTDPSTNKTYNGGLITLFMCAAVPGKEVRYTSYRVDLDFAAPTTDIDIYIQASQQVTLETSHGTLAFTNVGISNGGQFARVITNQDSGTLKSVMTQQMNQGIVFPASETVEYKLDIQIIDPTVAPGTTDCAPSGPT